MRFSTYALAITGSFAATVLVFVGCGGTIKTAGTGTTTGNGGSVNSGAGGHTAGVTVTASSSSTGSPSASSTSGGAGGASSGAGAGGAFSGSTSTGAGGAPALCQQGCAHAVMCGIDVCGMLNINCATVGNQFDCLLACVDGVSCTNFVGGAYACYQMCMGDGGPPPLDGGPPPFDGGLPMDAGPAAQCGQCGLGSCQAELLGCYQNTTCAPWGMCALACFQGNTSPGCFAACDAQYPNAKASYDAIYSCLCTSCSTQCAAADPCAAGMDGGP
jgi:hypothetical protein